MAVGTGDDFSNPLGCGVSRTGTVAVSLGTAETVAALHATPLIDDGLLVETHAYPGGLYHIGNPGWLSGGAVRWAAELLGIGSDAEFSALAGTAPPGCDGLIFIPALAGAMSPKWIAGARAGFIGLTASHGRAHLARAVLEGTAFAMRDIVDRLAGMGLDTGRLRLMGGGAQSRVWCEIRAALVRRPTEVLQGTDASAIGAALLATVAAGAAPDLATACAQLRLKLTRSAGETGRSLRRCLRSLPRRLRGTRADLDLSGGRARGPPPGLPRLSGTRPSPRRAPARHRRRRRAPGRPVSIASRKAPSMAACMSTGGAAISVHSALSRR